MSYACRILADSVNTSGNRLTTFEVTYPRFVHSELLTHRMLSRNSSSSRAIPITKMIEQVKSDPVMPVWWGKNQQGMQANEELDDAALESVKREWLLARDDAIENAGILSSDGLHKQIVNRLLEPWMWITVIVSATEWANFFHLRCHPDAQPEIQKIAYMMQDEYNASTPETLYHGEWHLPYVNKQDLGMPLQDLLRVCVGRCARVSYLTHDKQRDPTADIELCERLIENNHWSPFEHVAVAMSVDKPSGNFRGFSQYRKFFANENYTK